METGRKSPECSIFAYNSVTGDKYGDGIFTDGVPYGTHRTGVSKLNGNPLITVTLTVGNFLEHFPYLTLKQGPGKEIYGD